MPAGDFIQNTIHKLEAGAGARYLRFTLLGLLVLGLAVFYNGCVYRNFSSPEAMDAAQLARNISEGKGYTTQLVRPLSIYLEQSHNQSAAVSLNSTNQPDPARLKTAHPDLANAPVYPVVLAGLMKVLPFNFEVELKKSFWSSNGSFQRYQPDFLITIFNELLLITVAILTFFIARKLFDDVVAWIAAALVIGCELLWRFSASGLGTMLLMVIFLGVIWCLLKFEERMRETPVPSGSVLKFTILSGVLAGLGGLTLYSFGWIIFPVVAFLVLFGASRRWLYGGTALVAFLIVMLPWVIRNFAVSGTPFGTAGYAIVEGSFLFPRFQLERSLQPDFANVLWTKPYLVKLTTNARNILQNDLPKLGGNWVSMFFLVGLLLGFRGFAVRRMRYFLLMCLGLFIVVQALGRTQLSEQSPEVNSENLLILLTPFVFIYGVGLFVMLLDQVKFPLAQLRYAAMAVFVGICSLPLIFTLLPPRNSPVAYPPYFPPEIQKISNWMKPDELMMSDIPWAVAWYGDRQCVWLTLNAQSDFYAVSDYIKPVQALYLTPETMDGRFLTDWIRARELSWGSFIVQSVVQNQIPPKFPLHNAPTGFLPERLFLTDWERWKMTGVGGTQ